MDSNFREPTILTINVCTFDKVDVEFNGIWIDLAKGLKVILPYNVTQERTESYIVSRLKNIHFVPFDNRTDKEDIADTLQAIWDAFNLTKFVKDIKPDNALITSCLLDEVSITINCSPRTYLENPTGRGLRWEDGLVCMADKKVAI